MPRGQYDRKKAKAKREAEARKANHEAIVTNTKNLAARATKHDDDTAPSWKMTMRILSMQDGLVRDVVPVKSFIHANAILTEDYLLKGLAVLEVVIA